MLIALIANCIERRRVGKLVAELYDRYFWERMSKLWTDEEISYRYTDSRKSLDKLAEWLKERAC